MPIEGRAGAGGALEYKHRRQEHVVMGVHLGRGNTNRMGRSGPILSNQSPYLCCFSGVLEDLNPFSRPARSAAPSPLHTSLDPTESLRGFVALFTMGGIALVLLLVDWLYVAN